MTLLYVTFPAILILCASVCISICVSKYVQVCCVNAHDLMTREKQLSNMINLWVGKLEVFPFLTSKHFESDSTHIYLKLKH